jgi:hypothetical protein
MPRTVAETTILVLGLLSSWALAPGPATAYCVGDCTGDGIVAINELVAGMQVALADDPATTCPSFDANGNGQVGIDELIQIAANSRDGCADATCPAAQVKISVLNRRGGATPTTVLVTGHVRANTCPADAASGSDYVRSLTIPASCSGTCACGPGTVCTCERGGMPRCEYTVANLSPGDWLHEVEVPASAQKQYRRALVMGDRATSATVKWTAYKTVLTVTSERDDGSAGTLRHAIAAASGEGGNPPTLIQFDHGRSADGPITIRLTDPGQLTVAKETVVDGTDAGGNPSPLAPFASRFYGTIIELDPSDKAPANAATIRFNSARSGLRGIYLRRILGPDALISRRDQDLVAFGADAVRGFVESAKLDGGSAHRAMQDCPANTPTSATNPAQGKDCIDVEATGSRALADAVVVSESELRHCYDRAVKSQNAATIVRDSWIHNNSRGGLFVQSRNGKLQALRNLVEGNGRNCPAATRCRGGPRDGMSCCPAGLDGTACAAVPVLPTDCPGSADPGCGSGTCIPLDDTADVSDAACAGSATRRAAAQLSAESGGGTDLRTRQNVVRNGMRNGIFYRNDSSGSMQDDFICGMQFGIETRTGAAGAGQIAVAGTASVLNSHAGVLLNRSGTTIANVTFGDAAARPPAGMRNAFSNNGGASPTNFSMGPGGPTRKAERNQWQHGGDGAACRPSAVKANGVAPANAHRCRPVRGPAQPERRHVRRRRVSQGCAGRRNRAHRRQWVQRHRGYGSNDGAGGDELRGARRRQHLRPRPARDLRRVRTAGRRVEPGHHGPCGDADTSRRRIADRLRCAAQDPHQAQARRRQRRHLHIARRDLLQERIGAGEPRATGRSGGHCRFSRDHTVWTGRGVARRGPRSVHP